MILRMPIIRLLLASLALALPILLQGCSVSPLTFDGHEVVYQTDPVLIRMKVMNKDAAKRCASVHKKAVFFRRSCEPAGGDCTTKYKCE